jgi:8-oxo-dGTP pyrophosphatase MutT (NUDIX family)
VTAAPPVGSAENPVPRQGARVLLLDAAGRIMLVRGSDPARPGSRYWYTLGGGLDPGETVAEAGVRELFEEAGLRVAQAELGQVVWEETTDFPYDGAWYRQSQAFYLLRVDAWEVNVDGLAAGEEHYIHEHRWWSLADISNTDETIYPRDLTDILRAAGVGVTGGQ